MQIRCHTSLLSLFVGTFLLSTALFAQDSISAPVKHENWRSLFSVELKPKAATATPAKLIYLDFWASWCGPCKKSFPWMEDLNKRFSEKGLEVVAVSLDTEKKDAEKFLADHQVTFQVMIDSSGASAEKFNVVTMPSSFLLDPTGNVLATFAGFTSDNEDRIVAEISKRL